MTFEEWAQTEVGSTTISLLADKMRVGPSLAYQIVKNIYEAGQIQERKAA